MKAVGDVIGAPLKAIGLIPKMPSVPQATPPVMRDDAETAALANDQLTSRRGGMADQLTGPNGAQAGSTAKVKLG